MSVCLVCVRLYTIISRDLRVRPSPIFACYIMPLVRSSSGCVAIRYVFGFMDDVKFAQICAVWRLVDIPMPRVTSSRRCAQANALLRRVLGD